MSRDWPAEMAAIAIACGRDYCLGDRAGACVLDPEVLLPMEVEAVAFMGAVKFWKWFWWGWCLTLPERFPDLRSEEARAS